MKAKDEFIEYFSGKALVTPSHEALGRALTFIHDNWQVRESPLTESIRRRYVCGSLLPADLLSYVCAFLPSEDQGIYTVSAPHHDHKPLYFDELVAWSKDDEELEVFNEEPGEFFELLTENPL